ncbi:class I SAM-dependent methyltransferase [Rubricoccus marinus]|uniref:Methyltransferase domain-containing protein n=1 Tax=Rubricoccus marinus TaxID=716817 RepID=A0A259U083_9BACT|nr:class I SAM-dependent methyltransferase [Rubricoccus marinus]OZC03412.1 hypothetical protein BSZ36_10720 [Rubricoccus marinus]
MTHSRVSTVDWEDDIYAQGQQLNHWPFSDLVSAVYGIAAGRDPKTLRVLEVGAGAGNNVVFLAEAGFQTTAQDMSPSAIEYARQRLNAKGLTADLHVGDLVSLPFEDEAFDIVIDRGAFTQNSLENTTKAAAEAHRVLTPGGTLLCFDLMSAGHADKRFGTEVSHHAYDHFTDGVFQRVGLTLFVDEDDIEEIFAPFHTVDAVTVSKHRGETPLWEAYTITATK